jgi:hypothetical protein
VPQNVTNVATKDAKILNGKVRRAVLNETRQSVERRLLAHMDCFRIDSDGRGRTQQLALGSSIVTQAVPIKRNEVRAHRGPLASEADCVSDQQQIIGEIAPTGGASLDIRQAPLEILVDAQRHIDTPGAALRRDNNSRIEI